MRASESDRALICPASLTLPRHLDAYPRDKTELAAGLGTLTHYWKETGDWAPEWASDGDIQTLSKKLRLSGVQREQYWRPETGEHEVSFALQLLTLKLELFRGPRDAADAWKKSFDPLVFLTGTIDWLEPATRDTHARVDDLKTGSWQPDHKESKQLRSYLLVPWILVGMPMIWIGVQSMTWWPRYRLDAKPMVRGKKVSAVSLWEHLEDLRWAVTHPDEVNVTPTTYDENGRFEKMSTCIFCPCRELTPQTPWMQHYKHRAMPACHPGMLSQCI